MHSPSSSSPAVLSCLPSLPSRATVAIARANGVRAFPVSSLALVGSVPTHTRASVSRAYSSPYGVESSAFALPLCQSLSLYSDARAL